MNDNFLRKVEVNLHDFKYDILIKKDIINELGRILIEDFSSKKCFIITDSNVKKLYFENIKNKLASSGVETIGYFSIDAGEENKNIDTISKIYNTLAESECGRDDIIIALGGGVVGDVAGFVASTWMRGIRFIQVPTTVLACVDSSVGGKTGINIDAGKNLVGCFYHPSLVLIDSNMLKTLPDREFFSGFGEIVKHAMLFDEEMFVFLENNYSKNNIEEKIDELLEKNCKLKAHIVEIDFREKHERMLLNFGHTIGHSIEKDSKYSLFLHGEAVSLGIIFALKLGLKLGITKDINLIERTTKIFHNLNLPTEIPNNIDIFSAIKLDKKRSSDSINYIFIESLGNPIIKKIKIEDIIL